MHGLINRAIEVFVRDTYGRKTWGEIARRTDLGAAEFEPMLDYPDAVTRAVLDEVCRVLGKPREEVLEDIGTYLVSHPSTEALRRLLRFSGADFVEFLLSLDDLPARARLAVPDLILPPIELRELSGQLFHVTVGAPAAADRAPSAVPMGHAMIGLLRAMADDYGALVLLEHKGWQGGAETVEVHLLEAEFSAGRTFTLGAAE